MRKDTIALLVAAFGIAIGTTSLADPVFVECSPEAGCPEGAHCHCVEDDGILLSVKVDLNNDSLTDYSDVFTYHSDGRKWTMEHDADVDGTVNFRQTFDYDEAGNLTLVLDANGDGSLVSVWRYVYNEAGYVESLSQDLTDDGSIDSQTIYSYDENGSRTGYELLMGDVPLSCTFEPPCAAEFHHNETGEDCPAPVCVQP